MIAARAGAVEVMRYLLEKGVSYNVSDSDGRSLIELTMAWDNPEAISVLQKCGVDYSKISTIGGEAHPVWKAVQEGQVASVAKVLGGGFSIEYEHQGLCSLQLAIEKNIRGAARLLAEKGAAVDVADSYGWRALHSAAYSGNAVLLLLVLQKTENKEPKDQQRLDSIRSCSFL